jgi:hypothetical protein
VTAVDRPVMFDTPEADEILEKLAAFPPDHPWNADVSAWPAHPNSKAIIGSIGGGHVSPGEGAFRSGDAQGCSLGPGDYSHSEMMLPGVDRGRCEICASGPRPDAPAQPIGFSMASTSAPGAREFFRNTGRKTGSFAHD